MFYDRVTATALFNEVVDATYALFAGTLYRDPERLEHRGQPPVTDDFEDAFRLANNRAFVALQKNDEDAARIKLFVEVMLKLHALSSTDSKRKFASLIERGRPKPHPLGIAWFHSLDLNIANATDESRLERIGRGVLLYLSTIRTSLSTFIMFDLPDEVGVLRPLGIASPLMRLASRGKCFEQIKFIIGVTGVLPRINDLAEFIRRVGVNEFAEILHNFGRESTVIVPVCRTSELTTNQKISITSELWRIMASFTKRKRCNIVPEYVFSALRYTERGFDQSGSLITLQPDHGTDWAAQPPLSASWMPADRAQLVFVCKAKRLLELVPRVRQRNAKRALPQLLSSFPNDISNETCHLASDVTGEDDLLRWISTESLHSCMADRDLESWHDSAPKRQCC
jgi:hypothetical protein